MVTLGTGQWELIMSRNSPQSLSSPRGAGHHTVGSDANIRNFAPVARIMKTALPENAKIAKEAKECMQECVSEFISFITSEGTSASRPGRVRGGGGGTLAPRLSSDSI